MKRLVVTLEFEDDVADAWEVYLKRKQERAAEHKGLYVSGGIRFDAAAITSVNVTDVKEVGE
jgi:hypothetical protein